MNLNVGQVIKGLWWMPWGQGLKKGAARLREAAVSCLANLAGGARMGKPILGNTRILRLVGEVSGRTETSKYPEE